MLGNSKMNANIKNQIFNYIKAILNFEIFFQNNNKKHTYKGYIIDLKDYQNFKNNICYDILKDFIDNNENNSFDIKVKDLIKHNKIINNPNIKQIIFKNHSDLIKSIKNKEEFIIINKDLFKALNCDEKENEPCIKYCFDNLILTFNLDNQRINFINTNNNILNEKTYISEELTKLVESIIDF